MRPCGCSTEMLRAPAARGVAAGHRAGQREGGGDADGAGDGMRGMAAARREVARRDAVGVVAVADDHRLGDDAVRHVAEAHQLGRRRSASASRRSSSARSASSSAGVSRPLRPRSRARTIISGIAASMQVTSRPSMTSMRRPVGKHRAGHRAPGVEEVQPDRRRGAGDAVDAGLAVVGDAPARRQHGHVDARARVDVEHAHRRLAVLRRHQALLDRERRDARQHVAAVGPRVDRLLADADLGEQVVDVAARLRRTSRRSRPCWSACCRRRRRRAAAGRTRRWRRSAPRRAPPRRAGSQSRRKNGPRDVPARIRTQGMTRFMDCNDRRRHCICELHV